MKPSRGQLLRQNSRLPEDPTVGISISLPLTPRSLCLSSHPKSQDSEVRRAAAPTQPPQGAVSVPQGRLRTNVEKHSQSTQASQISGDRDPDTQEASPDAALPRLRQRTGTLARPLLTAQIVGPLIQHPLHGARGHLALACQPRHCSRLQEARITGSRAIAGRRRAGLSRRPGPVRGRPAGLTSWARGRGHCGGLRT